MASQPEMGQRIRDRRLELNLTLRELAEQVGVTSSFLSYVERGEVSPSLTTLARIADELSVPLAHFFFESSTACEVVQEDTRASFSFAGSNVSYTLLTRYPGSRFACMVVHLQPGTATFDSPQQHPQEECVLVLTGSLEMELGSKTYLLGEGDSAHYEGLLPHRFTCVGDERAVYMLVISPLVI